MFRNRLVWTPGNDNRLRLIVVAVLSSIFWGIVFYLFVDGFHLLRTTIAHEATRATTVHSVFNLFFLSLLVMITISSSIIFFSIAYRGRDVATCMTLPIRPRPLALMKLAGVPPVWRLGFLSAGKSHVVGLWRFRRIALVLLRRRDSLHDGLCDDPCRAGLYGLHPGHAVHAAIPPARRRGNLPVADPGGDCHHLVASCGRPAVIRLSVWSGWKGPCRR